MRLGRSAGFTLAELLVAVTLMAVVLAGLFALQDTLLRDQGRVLRDIAVHNQADFIRRMVLRDIEEATVVQSPAPGGSSTDLIGWKNLDAFNVRCDCAGSTCLPNGSCTNACAGAPPAQAQNWTSLVDLPKDAAGLPDAGGIIAADGVRLYGNDVTWFRWCLGASNRLFYYRGLVRTAATATMCPLTGACDGSCGAIAAPNCVAEEVAGTPIGAAGGFADGNAFRRAGRLDWVEVNIAIATSTTMGGLLQSTSAQVMLSGQMLRGVR